MKEPVALKLAGTLSATVHSAAVSAVVAEQLKTHEQPRAPALVVTRSAAMLAELNIGMIDAANLMAVHDGDWESALLIILPEDEGARQVPVAVGDEAFLADAARRGKSDALANLAVETLRAIREQGVDGELVDQGNGRWVNRPTNTFTLKVQPRAGNIHFTLYGNPETYGDGDFLKQDQNSYSRGWVHNAADAKRLAALAKQSHARRRR